MPAIIPAIIVFSVVIRLFHISTLPGEWYGDISNVYEYVAEILKGNWPFYFFQSPGPAYHYLIAPLILIFRHDGYEAYKYSSVAVSLLSLGAIYLFAKEAFNSRIASITILLSGFSLWLLIWSRLGNSQIIILAEVALSGFFLIRFFNRKKIRDSILSLLTASFGWYTYPQTFILPVFIFIFLLTYLFLRLKFSQALRQSSLALVVFLIGLLPMLFIIKNQAKGMAGNFSSGGYVGSKVLPVFKMQKVEFITKLGRNILKTALMLHLTGDNAFRVNVSKAPQLDRISGLLFMAGLYYLIRNTRPAFSIYLLLSFVVLSLPSLSPAIPDIEIPNNARTIGIIPMVYLLVSLGLWQLFLFMKKIAGRKTASVLSSVLLMFAAYINLNDYFRSYARGLPENNLGPSRIISSYIDKNIPAGVKLFFGDCCWGDWGQPEPKGITYSLKKDRPVDYSKQIDNCGQIDTYPSIIVLRNEDKFKTQFAECVENIRLEKIYSDNGIYITNLYLLSE